MREVHHTFSTQKNEALQKIMTVYCPKDQFFGGSMQLHDRLRYVVIEDSLGVHVGVGRLFHHMGLAPLHTIMSQWVGTRDNSNEYMRNYQQKLEARQQKRAAVAIAKMKARVWKDMKAEEARETYKTGVANNPGEPPKKKAKPTKAKTTTTKMTKKKGADPKKKATTKKNATTSTTKKKPAPKKRKA
eukprot:1621673-Ditylum_brightwellii.AAC.1